MWSSRIRRVVVTMVLAMGICFIGRQSAFAHCDTLDGPVAVDARRSLDAGDATAALKWVAADREAEIHGMFEKALVVRSQSAEARSLADMYFLETLVRIHRAGEGAPYTGLKPAGTPVEPGIAASDEALATGRSDALMEAATHAVRAGVEARFAKALEAHRHAEDSVEAGREFVAAYVDLTHYVEGIFAAAAGGAHGHGKAAAAHATAAVDHEPPASADEGGHRH
jgi:hypothetical protein